MAYPELRRPKPQYNSPEKGAKNRASSFKAQIKSQKSFRLKKSSTTSVLTGTFMEDNDVYIAGANPKGLPHTIADPKIIKVTIENLY